MRRRSPAWRRQHQRRVTRDQRPREGSVIIVVPVEFGLTKSLLHRLGVVRPAETYGANVTVAEVDAQTFWLAVRQMPFIERPQHYKQRANAEAAWVAVLAELERLGVDVAEEEALADLLQLWAEELHGYRAGQPAADVRAALNAARGAVERRA